MNKNEKMIALLLGKDRTMLKYSFLLTRPKSVESLITHKIQLSLRIKIRERFSFPFMQRGSETLRTIL